MEDFFSEFKPQKTNVYNKLLPYSDKVFEEAQIQFKEIKENLSKAIIYRDIRPGCIHWIAKLSRYIKIYGFYFSKEDHIRLVKLAYVLSVQPDQEFWVTVKFAQLLNILLKKKELLSPDDLELPWKPLADIYVKLFHSSAKNLGMIMIPINAELLFKNTIRSCRPYFALNATSEILTEWRPLLCPYDVSMFRAVAWLELFLPSMLSPADGHHGWKLWFDEFMGLWTSFHNEPAWGSSMFCLLARLSWHNIGHIDWEPYLPLIFTRVLWQFHLPVNYKKMSVPSRKGLDIWSIAMLIVSNLGGEGKTQFHLNRLFKILESYFHPSNTGYWTRPLNEFQMKLTHYFVQRLHNERYKKESWMTPVPKEKTLTEEDITSFVTCLQPSANLSVFGKTGSYEAGLVLHRLALLRPEIVIPPLLEQMYSAMDTMIEPHRLIASLQCMVRVARPLVIGGRKTPEEDIRYPEGATNVIPLLFQALPGIDPNDINKCMVTFQFIATFSALIPIVDCSTAIEEVTNLTEREQELCLQTRELENFVLQFITKTLGLIESLALDTSTNSEREKETLNLEENMVEIGLASTFKTILTQSHPKIFNSAIESLLSYTRGRSLEVKVAGKFVSAMWRSAAKVNSEKTLNLVLPSICRLILTLTENPDVIEDENIEEELLFNLLLLSELVQGKAKVLVKYVPVIIEVLERTIHLKNRKGYKMASSALRNLLWSLNLTTSWESKSFVNSWDTPFNEFLPIRHWGEGGNIDDLHIAWNEPGEVEEKNIELLVRTFLIPELIVMRKYAESDVSITRDRLHQSLCIAQDILLAGGSLPMWDEESISLIDMSVKKEMPPVTIRSHVLSVTIDHKDFSSNVRKAIADVTLDLVDYLLSTESDDTKALNYISTIYLNVSLFHGVKKEEFDARWKSFERIKQSLSDSVVKNKEHIRALLIERTILQYEIRILESSSPVFTSTHHRILKSLLILSTSRYSEVRRKSQGILSYFFRQFPYSYKLLIPLLEDILKKDPETNHKEIKGALYVIHGSKERCLAVRRDWDTLNALFPALISAHHSEKLSILKLYDSMLRTVCRHFELFAIHLQVPETAVNAAYNLLKDSSGNLIGTIDDQLEKESICALEQKSKTNLERYQSLVKKLALLLESGNLHWRRSQMCLNFLGILVRIDAVFPAEGVKAMLPFMISDNINLRKVVICYLPCIFKSQKQKHKKIKVDPFAIEERNVNKEAIIPGDDRPDNRWMQYEKSSALLNKEEWDKKIFIHKTWNGWYCWPKEVEIYAPSCEQPRGKRPYEELKEEEKPVYDFFSNEDNLSKLMHFLSLEESKGFDKFDTRKCTLFKGLFRNFGDVFLGQMVSHLENMIGECTESSQRCAAEIIAGMIRGSKHWEYESSQNILEVTCKLFKKVFSKILNETLDDWGACMTYISMDRDPNRLAILIELFMEDLIPEGEPSFIISSRLHLTQLFLEQQEWRIADCHHRVLEAFEAHLASPFKSIRDRIGSFLFRILMRDDSITNVTKTRSPHHATLVDKVLPQLAALAQEGASGYYSTDLSLHDSHTHSTAEPSVDPILSLSLPMETDDQDILRDYDTSSRPDSPKEVGESCSTISLDPLKESLKSGKSFMEPVKEFVPALGEINVDVACERGDTLERKIALRLTNTICKYLSCMASFTTTSFPSELYKFVPYLCQLESIDSDSEVRNNCLTSLACLSRTILTTENVLVPLNILKQISINGSWRSRIAAISYLQVLTFTNMFSVLANDEACEVVRRIVLDTLEDSRAEVRQMASQILSGLFHSNFLPPHRELLENFVKKINKTKKKKSSKLSKPAIYDVTESHTGALGLIAYIGAYPYDVPSFMPEALIILSEHVHDPPPVSTDIKQCLSHFKRTHHDNWIVHKTKFSPDQLSILTDVLVSPSYYA